MTRAKQDGKKQVSFFATPELHKKIRVAAAERNLGLSKTIELAVEKLIDMKEETHKGERV